MVRRGDETRYIVWSDRWYYCRFRVFDPTPCTKSYKKKSYFITELKERTLERWVQPTPVGILPSESPTFLPEELTLNLSYERDHEGLRLFETKTLSTRLLPFP